MADPPASRPALVRELWVLTRCRAAQVKNALDQQLKDAPWRTLTVLALLLLIWTAIYFMLSAVLGHIRRWELIAVVANQHIFIHFFLVLTVMLAFSNAILTFGTLFGRDEAGYLLGMPVHPRKVVCVKWIEGVVLSSWSFLLLGVPLMLAVARASSTTVEWYYYPLFLGHFLGFVAIPACLGLLAAWAVAMWAPRRPLAIGAGAGVVLIALGVLWIGHVSRQAVESEEWLHSVLGQIGLAKQPFLPSTWTAKGIVAALNRHVGESLFYLGVVAANGAFLSWLTVNLLGRTWSEAYSRAQHGRYRPIIRWGLPTLTLCWGLFFYLPRRLRTVMLKDLRSFARDARQWTQMLIMFGLLVVYVLNLRRMPIDWSNPGMKTLVAFLNLTTVSLILATFTSRFVYPLLSLESQQLWLLGMLPTRRIALLLVKFFFALTVTLASGCGVMTLAVRVLELPEIWARINVGVCALICVGLSALAIGLGARFPLLGQRNPARIASGFGGTFNLIASMLFVVVEMAGAGYLTLTEYRRGLGLRLPDSLSPDGVALLVGLAALAAVVTGLSLWVGARHFNRLEG